MLRIMESMKGVLLAPLRQFIHKDFHPIVERMTLIDRLLFLIIYSLDKWGILWHRLPVALGLVYLAIRRRLHEEYNLFNVGRTPTGIRFNPADFPFRTADGKFNDPFNEVAGSEGTFFGRNILPVDQKDKLKRPDPMVVATKLLARKNIIDTGKQFNMIAASWIQFMIHDWVDHLEDTQQIELKAPREVANECPLNSFKFYKTKEVPTGFYEIKSGHLNTRTPWWDASSVYGSNAERLQRVRTFKDGKLKLSKDGLLLHDQDGIAISGDVRNSWAGVSVLQALFIKEHNAVCDALKKEYPELEDEDLYRRARLVTSAVIAKVHTIDWTIELLKTDTLRAAMRANWYGLLGKKFKDTFGHVGGVILALENQVLKAWNVLARRQISTQLIEIESRPHITLFSSPFVDPSKLENIVKNLATKQEPLPLSFRSIGALPIDNNVLFLAPNPSLSLLHFHLQLCDAMRKEGIEIGEEYRPDSWIPYCPVAEEVPKARMAEAFTVLRDLKLPVSGYAMEIGLVEYSPVRELFSYVLGNAIEP